MSTVEETKEGFYLGEDGEWIPDGWNRKKWEDEIKLNYGKAIKGYQQKQAGYPVYGTNGPIGYHEEKLFNGPGVILGRKGANRGVEYSTSDFWVVDTAYAVKPKNGNLPKWLYYKLIADKIGEIDDGSPIPLTPRAFVYATEVNIPLPTEQKAIAAVLGSLDDKIELLREQNETLEALAQTLFKRWFIDFNFPDENGNPYKDSGGKMTPSELGEMPESWEIGSISLFANHIKNSVSPDKSPETRYRHYSIPSFDDGMKPVLEKGSEIKSNKYEVIASSILVSKLNPSTPRIWQVQDVEENSICSTEFQVVRPQRGFFGFVYGALMSSPVRRELTGRAHGTSSSHQRVTPVEIFEGPFPVSGDRKLEEAFSQTTHGLLTKAVENRSQMQTLTRLRDTLLPKLMKGEIRVSKQ